MRAIFALLFFRGTAEGNPCGLHSRWGDIGNLAARADSPGGIQQEFYVVALVGRGRRTVTIQSKMEAEVTVPAWLVQDML